MTSLRGRILLAVLAAPRGFAQRAAPIEQQVTFWHSPTRKDRCRLPCPNLWPMSPSFRAELLGRFEVGRRVLELRVGQALACNYEPRSRKAAGRGCGDRRPGGQSGKGETLTAPPVDSVNTFAAPGAVVPKPINAIAREGRLTLRVEPKSVTMLSLE
jgi:hypothetical protein